MIDTKNKKAAVDIPHSESLYTRDQQRSEFCLTIVNGFCHVGAAAPPILRPPFPAGLGCHTIVFDYFGHTRCFPTVLEFLLLCEVQTYKSDTGLLLPCNITRCFFSF
jgi:hypothetical protein